MKINLIEKGKTLSFLSDAFEEKHELFYLENASNLTHERLFVNLNKLIEQNFLVEIVIQKLMCQFFLGIFKAKWFNIPLSNRGA